MLNICLSFDYELFLGKNFSSDEEVLFRPTYKIMKALKENEVSGTFFADVCSIEQHKKYGKINYIKEFTEQIKEMEKQNQDVQLHIHPNWLCSEWKDGEWKFDLDSYRIHYFGFDKTASNHAAAIIKNGIDFLNEALMPVKNDYICCAYRAGGFSIQPHEELVKALLDSGIMIDSSIAPHLKSLSQTNHYDFSKPPKVWNWWLSSKDEWNKPGSEKIDSIFEVPVGTANKNPLKFLFTKLFHEDNINLPAKRRNGAYINEICSPNNVNRIKSIIQYVTSYNALSLDSYNYHFLWKQLEKIYDKYDCLNKDSYICLICHPKLATDESIHNMVNLISLLKEHNNKYAFFNMRNVYDKVILTDTGRIR